MRFKVSRMCKIFVTNWTQNFVSLMDVLHCLTIVIIVDFSDVTIEDVLLGIYFLAMMTFDRIFISRYLVFVFFIILFIFFFLIIKSWDFFLFNKFLRLSFAQGWSVNIRLLITDFFSLGNFG
jgi:hypothetical protein